MKYGNSQYDMNTVIVKVDHGNFKTISNSKFYKVKLSQIEFSGCLIRSADLCKIMLDLLCVQIKVFNHMDLNKTKSIRAQSGAGSLCCKYYKPNACFEIVSEVT